MKCNRLSKSKTLEIGRSKIRHRIEMEPNFHSLFIFFAVREHKNDNKWRSRLNGKGAKTFAICCSV